MKTIQPVTKGLPGSLLEAHRANEVITAINLLRNMKVVVDPNLSTNSSRLEDNGNSLTLVIGLRN